MKKKKFKKKVQKEIVELDVNPVREYLKSNCLKKLSINYLKKNLPETIKKRKIYHYCTHSKFIRQVKPFEVGSGRMNVNVFQFEE
jgi:hypothetical protein|tara:strand:+ start:73 stop:327 length:255 start_codon:yes stop_codon:yes gene_type:complete